MNDIDPDFMVRCRQAFASNAPLSLRDTRDRVAASDPGDARRDTLSAIDTVARVFGKDLHSLRGTPEVVRELFGSKTAIQLGLSTKRYANVRSSVITAIKVHGEAPLPITKRIPLTADWRALLDRIDRSTYRFALYRLACFCSFMSVPPAGVNSGVLAGFFEALVAEDYVKHPRRILKHTIAHWNMCHRQVPGWPGFKIASPFEHDLVSLPLSVFPASFQNELHRWAQRMTDPDPFDRHAPAKPLRTATVKGNIAMVLRFASALVHRGELKIEEITGLDVFFDVARFKSGLRFFLERFDNKPTPYIAKIATTLHNIARHHCRLDDAPLAELSQICRRLDGRRRRQLTPRNRERLRQFDDPENVRSLLAFPQEERARGLEQKNPYRAAKCLERALTVALFNHCTPRIGTLRRINITTDISWAGGKCYLSIDGSRVKNDEALEFELPGEVAALLKEYVTKYRPRLPGSEGPYLFPGRDGGPRPHSTMATDYGEAMRKRAGLVMNPHLERHAIAKIVIERDPGLVLAMSRQLGHKRVDTTMAHYLGTETRAAARHINKLLKKAIDDPELPED